MLFLFLNNEVDNSVPNQIQKQVEILESVTEHFIPLILTILVFAVFIVVMKNLSSNNFSFSSSNSTYNHSYIKPNKNLEIPELETYINCYRLSRKFLYDRAVSSGVTPEKMSSLLKIASKLDSDYEFIILHLNEFGNTREISMSFLKNQHILNTIYSTLNHSKNKRSDTAINLQFTMVEDFKMVTSEIKKSIVDHENLIITSVKEGQNEEKEIMENIIEKRNKPIITVALEKTK